MHRSCGAIGLQIESYMGRFASTNGRSLLHPHLRDHLYNSWHHWEGVVEDRPELPAGRPVAARVGTALFSPLRR